ncbi:Crp/Fnr family transcriptional regulator [Paucibacter sp. TC2R-5]|uniref:Crp/Fnr family transcriptional regulator n=1 Tax=Paucibacter sp. TC2R-5 TaxID=2893555 RepID=UPI0021E4E812|nr:Crp/Fnr family transcriptional regulator [Paucibacter sp. TC2R-5]MCV2358179.1 Crp/Fnr family transcriptional regulator [Paucibacter sp. TC2R-5]
MDPRAETSPASDRVPVASRAVKAGATLFRQSCVADAIYFVSMGSFKVFRTAEDGYEQVLCFVGAAELLGYDALCTHSHPTEALALEDSRVCVVPLHELFALGQATPAFDRMLHLAVSRQLTRHGEVTDVMAAVAAEVRLARFLLNLSARMQARGQSPRRLLLRMCRRDIASHLGVAHETVSRSFTALADLGYLQVRNREVEILYLPALIEFARSTRGSSEDLMNQARCRVSKADEVGTAGAMGRESEALAALKALSKDAGQASFPVGKSAARIRASAGA